MHSVQANGLGDLIVYIIYAYWMAICTPITGFFSFVSALFFGDYVNSFYNGVDFCSGAFLDSAKNSV